MTEEAQPLRILHVDDDAGFIERFRKLLGGIQDIPTEYLGGFTNAGDALLFLKENGADLIFLDVEMPGQDGWWLAEQIKDMKIDIIFLTAHSGYALKAFEVCALNFIVKPPAANRLEELLRVAMARPKNGVAEGKEQLKSFYKYITSDDMPDKIFINQIGVISIVKLDEIVYFNALKAYTSVIMADGETLLTSKTIRTFSEILERNKNFIRVSRSAIINKNYVKSIQRDMKTKQISFEMNTGQNILTSMKTKEEALEMFTGG